jgi:hypothetical protein
MECKQIEQLIEKNEQWNEVFTHIQGCPECAAKYLVREPHLLMKSCAVPELPEEFWIQQRATIIAEVQKDTGRRRFAWLKYAAAILVPAAIVLISYNRNNQNPTIAEPRPPEPQVITMPQPVHQYPLIDEIKNPGARYYKIQLDNKTQLVMIVDSKMDI